MSPTTHDEDDEIVTSTDARQGGGVQDRMSRTLLRLVLILVILVLGTAASIIWYALQIRDLPRTTSEQAVIQARSVVHQDPGDPEKWAALALAYARVGARSDAQTAIEAGRELADHPSLDYVVAMMSLLAGDEVAAEQQFLDAKEKAEAYYDQAESDLLDRGITQDLYRSLVVDCSLSLARMYVDAGRYREALTQYDDALEENPVMADILVERGKTHEALGDVDAARDDYEEALRFTPDSEEALQAVESLGDDR